MKNGSTAVVIGHGADAGFDARVVMRLLYSGEVAEALPRFAERAPAEWERVCGELFESQVATLFFSLLKRSGLESLTALPMLARFRCKYEATLAANILIQEQFLRLETVMREGGVGITPLKGLELIEGVYDDIAARAMADIDIFVSPHDGAKAARLLRGEGYKCIYDDLVRSVDGYNSGFKFYRDKTRQTNVELHWNIMDPAGVRMNMMSRRQSLSLSGLLAESRVERVYKGKKILALTAGHSLLYMLLHIYGHNFSGDKWFWDIPHFLEKRGGEVDWDDFFGVVSRYRLEKIVHSGFLVAERAIGMPVAPEEARRRFAELPAPRRWVCEKIASCERRNTRMLLDLLLHTSAARMLMTVARYFFPTRRQLEITACRRVRWRDYPRMFLKLRIGKLFRA